jgi:hypothetical protein
MQMSVCRLYVLLCAGTLAMCAAPSIASAQYRPQGMSGEAIGENYHIEAAYDFWNATPTLIVNSEALGILGTDVDLISDLGIEKHRLGTLNLTLKPSKKHRLRFQYLPIKYDTDSVQVNREFIFNGQRYNIGLPVTTNVDFTTYGFGYQYDFLYFKRGFVGAGINLKYTNVDVNLASPIGAEFVSAAAPIPAISIGGRGYVTPNLAVDSELAFFRIPDKLSEQIEGDGSYTDFDLHATYNFNKNVGFRFGWRRTHIFYNVDLDRGDLEFKGTYFGGVIRY